MHTPTAARVLRTTVLLLLSSAGLPPLASAVQAAPALIAQADRQGGSQAQPARDNRAVSRDEASSQSSPPNPAQPSGSFEEASPYDGKPAPKGVSQVSPWSRAMGDKTNTDGGSSSANGQGKGSSK